MHNKNHVFTSDPMLGVTDVSPTMQQNHLFQSVQNCQLVNRRSSTRWWNTGYGGLVTWCSMTRTTWSGLSRGLETRVSWAVGRSKLAHEQVVQVNRTGCLINGTLADKGSNPLSWPLYWWDISLSGVVTALHVCSKLLPAIQAQGIWKSSQVILDWHAPCVTKSHQNWFSTLSQQ